MAGVGAKAVTDRLRDVVGAQARVQNAAREAAATIAAEREPQPVPEPEPAPPDEGAESTA